MPQRSIYNERMVNRKYPFQRAFVCDLCKRRAIGYGHDPTPLLPGGVVCYHCNAEVIRYRIEIALRRMGLYDDVNQV